MAMFAIITNFAVSKNDKNDIMQLLHKNLTSFTKELKSYGDLLPVSSNNCLTVVSATMFCLNVHNFQLLYRLIRPRLLDIWCTEINRNLKQSLQLS